MIEIIVIWRLAVYIGKIAAQKGLKKPRYQVMAILLWICGELLGSVLGNIIFGKSGSFWLIYGMALIGAIAGTGIAFLIMKFLPNQHVVLVRRSLKTKQGIPPVQNSGAVNLGTVLITIFIGNFLFMCGRLGVWDFPNAGFSSADSSK